ncbi:MAG TPA: nucleoside hydrolase [Candidatus Limnocylindria bacterium]|nr:nucleoside hydrolase [Candidatus Limnocylindria bacterium]
MRTRRSAAALVLGVVVLAACGLADGTDRSGSRPLIVDLDMDSSDVMALAYATQLPGYQLVAVTVPATGVARCPLAAGNATRLLAELGKSATPVACGTETAMGSGHAFPDAWRNPADAMYGVRLEAAAAEGSSDAVSLLRETLRTVDEPVDLLTLGPLTNVASALRAEPQLAERIARVVMMAGAFAAPGNVDTPSIGSAEWNAWADPEALAAVLGSDVDVVMVPLDATDDVPVDRGFYGDLSGNHAAAAADVTYELLTRNAFLLDAQQYFWDPLAATFLEEPGVLDLQPMQVRIGTDPGRELGRTIAGGAGRPVQVARAAIRETFAETFLAGLRRGNDRAQAFTPGGPLTVRYDGTTCALDGATDLSAGPVRLSFSTNEDRQSALALVTLHADATWDQLQAYVTAYRAGSPNPDFVDLQVPMLPAPGVEVIADLPAGVSGVACFDHANGITQRVVLSDSFEVAP